MSNDLAKRFERMKADHEAHRDRLIAWKAAGGELQNFPEGETVDDMIARERRAVENLERAITILAQPRS